MRLTMAAQLGRKLAIYSEHQHHDYCRVSLIPKRFDGWENGV